MITFTEANHSVDIVLHRICISTSYVITTDKCMYIMFEFLVSTTACALLYVCMCVYNSMIKVANECMLQTEIPKGC